MEGAHHLAAAIAVICGLLDVRRIVLVGSALTLGEAWLEAIRSDVRARVLHRLGERVDVEFGATTQNDVVLGASALLMSQELGLVPVS
jgi:predicted NBD/HSP70 family sugar kinase